MARLVLFLLVTIAGLRASLAGYRPLYGRQSQVTYNNDSKCNISSLLSGRDSRDIKNVVSSILSKYLYLISSSLRNLACLRYTSLTMVTLDVQIMFRKPSMSLRVTEEIERPGKLCSTVSIVHCGGGTVVI